VSFNAPLLMHMHMHMLGLGLKLQSSPLTAAGGASFISTYAAAINPPTSSRLVS
jgi:hypothetical protein